MVRPWLPDVVPSTIFTLVLAGERTLVFDSCEERLCFLAHRHLFYRESSESLEDGFGTRIIRISNNTVQGGYTIFLTSQLFREGPERPILLYISVTSPNASGKGHSSPCLVLTSSLF